MTKYCDKCGGVHVATFEDSDACCPYCDADALKAGNTPDQIQAGDGEFDGPAGGPLYCNIYTRGEAAIVGTVTAEDLGPADASATLWRVLAAYNATAGVPLETLQADGVAELIEAAAELLDFGTWQTDSVRDRLKNAIERMRPKQ